MPAPLLIPLIGAGASILGNVIGATSQARQNAKAREFSLQMYDRQRSDALADWERNNAYNSPVEQMARLRDAGLNPNLVYGQGAVANSSMPPRSVDHDAWRPEAFRPDLSGIGSSLSQIYDIQLREAQTDNMRAATVVAGQEAALKAAQIASTAQSTAKSEFELELAKSLRLTSIDMAKAQLRKLDVDTGIALDQNERAAAANAQSLQKGAEEILSIRLGRAKTEDERRLIVQQMNSVKQDIKLKQLDIELKQKGIMPGDPMWSRVLARLLGDTGGVRPITAEDWKPSALPDSTLDRMKIPYKSGWQIFKEKMQK